MNEKIRAYTHLNDLKEFNKSLDELPSKEEIICPICGLDGFANQDDLDIHLEDCDF